MVITMMKWKHQIKLTGTTDMILRYARLKYRGSDVLVFLVYLLCCVDLCSILGPEGIKKDLKKLQAVKRNFKP